MKTMAVALLILILTGIVVVLGVLVAHAQTAIIGPDGRITYLYSYGPGLPLAVIPPAGGRIYHAIPMTPPSAYVPPPPPVYVPQPAYVPPTYSMPTFTPPSFGGN